MTGTFHVYILSNRRRTVLYIGVTNNLQRRLAEHKAGQISSFTKKYKATELVYFEFFNSIEEAIAREKQLKGWRREKKLKLVLKFNRYMKDLSNDWF